MFDSEDIWPLPNYITGPTKQVHALGVMSLNFNMFEASWRLLLVHYLGKDLASFLLLGKVSKEQRADAVKYAIRKETDPAVVENINWALDYFNNCAVNRDHLIHSKQRFGYAAGDLDRLNTEKWSIRGNKITFNWHLLDLRAVADEIMTGVFFLIETLDFVRDRDGLIPDAPLAPLPWPEKPALPRIRDHSLETP